MLSVSCTTSCTTNSSTGCTTSCTTNGSTGCTTSNTTSFTTTCTARLPNIINLYDNPKLWLLWAELTGTNSISICSETERSRHNLIWSTTSTEGEGKIGQNLITSVHRHDHTNVAEPKSFLPDPDPRIRSRKFGSRSYLDLPFQCWAKVFIAFSCLI